MSPWAFIGNGDSLPTDEVPLSTVEALQAGVAEALAAGARLSALFGAPGEPPEIWAIFADPERGLLRVGRARGARWPAMSPEHPALQLFERELHEQHGVEIPGHPWLKPVRFAPPLRGGPAPAAPIGEMDFYRVGGAEIHEVAVGPVHAGVIEPGHFRFQCHGETVLHLEISLGYQHRGVERALLGGPHPRSLHLAETLAGDSTIAHATAYAAVVEGLGGASPGPRARAIRALALELERLANHTGDLGALAGDVAFLPTASFCGRLRGDWLNMTARLCGNRFGRGLVRPGGVAFRLEPDRADALIGALDHAMSDLAPSMRLLWETPGVLARFEETGRVDAATAAAIGLVGPAARASGLPRDARRDLPLGAPGGWPIATAESGDVFARAKVRADEVHISAKFVRDTLEALPEGPAREAAPLPRPGRVSAALVEGWRGEVAHAALTDAEGRFSAYKVVDPSFHNWMGLAMALRGQQISDFPLCNKSFNLSYCGFDL